MNKLLDLFTFELYKLYDAYEDHAFNSYVNNNNKYGLVLRFFNNAKIGYMLFDNHNNHLIDDVYFDFENREYDLFYALSIRLFVKALGNVMIHKLDDNTYGNKQHKSYVEVITDDEKLINMFDKLLENQENEYLNLDNDLVKKVSQKAKLKYIDRHFIYQIEDRILLTRELLRR